MVDGHEMVTDAGFKRYTTSDVHWRLIAQRRIVWRTTDARVWDEEEWVQAQALFCPYYDTIEGRLGGDWGVIFNPESVKFGQLVFEHEWCGCPGEDGPYDPAPLHRGGEQGINEWVDPQKPPCPRCGEPMFAFNGNEVGAIWSHDCEPT